MTVLVLGRLIIELLYSISTISMVYTRSTDPLSGSAVRIKPACSGGTEAARTVRDFLNASRCSVCVISRWTGGEVSREFSCRLDILIVLEKIAERVRNAKFITELDLD